MRIKKRDGSFQQLEISKIQRGLLMAFQGIKAEERPDVMPLVHRVMDKLVGVPEPVSIEVISDMVEEILVESGHADVARRYMQYRVQRAALRKERLKPDKKAISEYIHVGKYARYLPSEGRRELFQETVQRDENMHLNRWPDLADEINWAFGYVYRKQGMPSMRSMQFGGLAIERDNARIYNCSFGHISRWRSFQEFFYLLLCGCGVGYSVQWHHVEQLSEVQVIDKTNVCHYTIDDSIRGWADALGRLLESYYLVGSRGHFKENPNCYVEFNYSEIRAEGEPLITSGGRAPGHLPLKRCLEKVRTVMDGAAGRKLRPIECHDIMCYTAEAVLAGGIRRSAMISLFSPEDTEMLYCKARGSFRPAGANGDPGLNSQREMANNSAALLRSDVRFETFERIIRVAQEGFGCPGFYFTNNLDYGPNPCVTGETLLHTSQGLKRIGSLVGKGPVQVVQADGSLLPASEVQLTGRDMAIYKVTLQSGHTIRATSYHRFPTLDDVKQLKDLKIGDKLFLQHEEGRWGISGTYEEGLMLGLWLGDGTYCRKSGSGYLQLWDEDRECSGYIKSIVDGLGYDYEWKEQTDGSIRYGGVELGKDLPINKDLVPENVMLGGREIVKGFLEGLVFTDGSLQGTKKKGYSLRINQSNKGLLEQVQVLLSNFGIFSKIRMARPGKHREMPGGIYYCKDNYELIISSSSMQRYMEKIGIFGPKLLAWERIQSRERGFYKQKNYSPIVSIEADGVEDVYCLKQPKTERVIFNGIKTLNCGEIGMWPMINFCKQCKSYGNPDLEYCEKCSSRTLEQFSGISFCNLTEVNCAVAKNKEQLLETVEAMATIGTLQAAWNSFDYLGPVTEAIVRREALLGVGLTGIMDNRELILDASVLREAAEVAVRTNIKIAGLLGIEPAARVTTIKPSGTASLELGGVGSGIHPRWARRYFQRVTANKLEPQAVYFREINPHMIEEKPNGDWAIVFPVECADDAVTVKDWTAQEFLDAVFLVYENWILPGTARPGSAPGLTHNVSCTVTVRDDELDDIIERIWTERDRVAAMSFVPYLVDKKFAFAPRQAVSSEQDEARWNHLIRLYKPVDWSLFKEGEDMTKLSGESACSGGACEIA